MARADRIDARRGRQTPLGGRPERLVAAAVCFLVCFGLVMVYSASSARAFLQAGDPLGLLKRQAVYAVVGLGAYCFCARVQPSTLRRLGRPALVVSGLLLLVVLVPGIGVSANGASRWLALGSGGIFGQGIGQGLQKVSYLPEAHTDMIVATVGEELGLLGVLALIAAFGAVALAGYRIALGARDLHLRVLAAGLTTVVVVQAVINFGAVLGVLPVTGVPLPFVSFGGSSLIVFLAAAGILVNIGRRSAATRPAPGPHAVAPSADPDEGGHRRRWDRRPRHAGARLGGGAARARG